MAKIGPVVYQCDTCTRRVRLPTSLYSFEVVQRCIITLNCPGKLFKITNQEEINATPVFPPEVVGLDDWFPRNILFNHTQGIAAPSWTIQHNLGVNPLVQVLVDRVDSENNLYQIELAPSEYTVVVVDLNTIIVSFSRFESGIAQCIGTASTNLVNPEATTAAPIPDMLLTSGGELTIATTNSNPLISVSIVYKAATDTTISYVGIDDVPSINSPWVGANVVHINGKNYTVRSFNILTTSPAPAYFSGGLVRDGSPIFFDGLGVNANEDFILLGKSPFAAVDRITDQVIDIATISSVNPTTYYNKGAMYASPNAPRSIYPPVIVVV